ncbi:phosphatidate cytidylyltransferase [Facklamia sp. DSM 111018]|uniref:Phosphatidate cytidylyltransferase n=1 Tax=Facklamia lactis TaxID=2749967 RepID=A0ABS0LMA3_9LACT|nr:phosphatidate cytidylyltransferase [Facklamia lactis]MBG9985293.1 phosphatidate cytidylyltransferase [Facklamia lactis]
MKLRIITALIAMAIFIPFLYVGGHWFAWVIFVLGAIGLYEIAKMKKIKYFGEIGIISTVALASVVLPGSYLEQIIPISEPLIIFYICGMLLLILTVYRYKYFNFVDAATLIFAALYIGFGFRFIIEIRNLGLPTMIYLFLVIWSTDTGAYFVGKHYGSHKLASYISPNKTIEGALGGIITSLIVTGVYSLIFKLQIPGQDYIGVLTILISLAGQFGDLVESAYKRYFQVKDSGSFLPGHGGVLDRFDSTLFASIMFMVWVNFAKM